MSTVLQCACACQSSSALTLGGNAKQPVGETTPLWRWENTNLSFSQSHSYLPEVLWQSVVHSETRILCLPLGAMGRSTCLLPFPSWVPFQQPFLRTHLENDPPPGCPVLPGPSCTAVCSVVNRLPPPHPAPGFSLQRVAQIDTCLGNYAFPFRL